MYTLFQYSRSFTNLPVGQGIRPLFHVMAHSIPLCDKMGCRYSGLDHCKKQVQTLVTNNLRKWLLTPIYRNIKSLQEFQGIIESCVLPFPMVVWQLYLHLPMQSMPINTKVLSLIPDCGVVYSIQHIHDKVFISNRFFFWILQFPTPLTLNITI